MHAIAGKAVAFRRGPAAPSFKTYARQVVDNAKCPAGPCSRRGFDIVSGGTDTHLLLVDLRPRA